MFKKLGKQKYPVIQQSASTRSSSKNESKDFPETDYLNYTPLRVLHQKSYKQLKIADMLVNFTDN